jgi:hypothetical protein
MSFYQNANTMENPFAPIQEYVIITAQNVEDLQKQVQEQIRKGWHLHGQLVSSGMDYAREMVRYAVLEEEN